MRARHEIRTVSDPLAGFTRSSPRLRVDSCTANNLSSLPLGWRREHNVAQEVRGAGFWKWKPYYLLRRLEALPEGDVLVHLDYDLTITQDTSALFCLGQNAETGVALVHFPCWNDRQWSKAEVVAAPGEGHA